MIKIEQKLYRHAYIRHTVLIFG